MCYLDEERDPKKTEKGIFEADVESGQGCTSKGLGMPG